MPAVAATTSAAGLIDWGSLGKVAGVSFVFGITIITLFSVGILGLSWMRADSHAGVPVAARHDAVAGSSGLAANDSDAEPPAGIPSRQVGTGLAALCFAICAAAVLYGLWLIIPQFH